MYTQVDERVRPGTRVAIRIPGHRHNNRTGIVEGITTLGGYTLAPHEYRPESVVHIRFDDNLEGVATFRAYMRTVFSIQVKTTHEVW